MRCVEHSSQSHRKRTFWILAVVISSTAIVSPWGFKRVLSREAFAAHPQQGERLSVNDGRPVASAIVKLESRFGRVITYEDLPWAHADDIADVTESVRRDLQKYAPGKAPRVIVPRGGAINLEFNQTDSVETVLAQLLNASEGAVASATFRMEETNGVFHVIPQSVKGPTGDTVAVRSILDAPVELPPQERTSMQLLEAWRDSVIASSQKRIILGWAPLNIIGSYKDDRGLSSPNARDALTEIVLRAGGDKKLSWQLLYDPGQQFYAVYVHLVR